MKKNLLFILFLLWTCSVVYCQTDSGRVAGSDIIQKPASIELVQSEVFPVDTQAVLKLLKFERLSYDSLFSPQNNISERSAVSKKHMRKRDVLLPVLLLFMLVYVTWLRYVFTKELKENITVLLNTNLGQQIYRDREFSANIFKLLTFINFTFIGGVFIYLLSLHFQVAMPFENKIINIALSIGLIVVLYIVKGIVYYIIAAGFKAGNALNFFRFNSLVIYHLLGIGMLPLVILAAFAEEPLKSWSLYATLVLIGIAMLMRLIKGFTAIRMAGRFHIVYFLLYICALEIAPLLIAVKLFSAWG